MPSELAQHNRSHFDEKASQYSKRPDALEGARRISKAMKKAYPFDEEKTVVMDYACGTGMISMHLAAHVKCIVGIDISQGMVDIYNERVKNQGIDPSEMRAIVAELKGEEGELEGLKFDVIVCSLSYHHFDSVSTTTQLLYNFLKPGGYLLVADIAKYIPTGEDHMHHKHMVNHAYRHGFTEQEMRETFEAAGFQGFECTKITTAYRGSCSFAFDSDASNDTKDDEKVEEKADPKGDKTFFFLAKGMKAVELSST